MILASMMDPEMAVFLAQKTLAGQTQQMAAFQVFVQALLGLVPAFPFPVHPFPASNQVTGFRQGHLLLPCPVLF
jgi:hypothetical protein